MMTMTLGELAVPTAHEIAPRSYVMDRAVIRVIWGRALGSTYQKSVNGRESSFSVPLTCPECRGRFELHQVVGKSTDHLVGTCSCCQTSRRLTVGEAGRITLD